MEKSTEHSTTPHPALYEGVRLVLSTPLLGRYGPVYYEGVQTLREVDGPFIVAPVHRSMLDPFAVADVAAQEADLQVHFMAKKELWKIPLLGRILEAGGCFSVDRAAGLGMEIVDHVASIADRNGVIGIFPEGTRQKGSKIERSKLKRGTIILAAALDLPIVPCGIAGTEKGDRRPIAVAVGQPFTVPHADIDLSDTRQFVRIANRQRMGELQASLQAVQDRAIALRREAQFRKG